MMSFDRCEGKVTHRISLDSFPRPERYGAKMSDAMFLMMIVICISVNDIHSSKRFDKSNRLIGRSRYYHAEYNRNATW